MIIKKELLINLIISTIPISFIAGNLLLNLNILLIIMLCLFFFRLKIFDEKLELIDKLFLILFTYILLNGLINDYFKYEGTNVIFVKSLSYIRFLILYFVFKYLVKNNLINYKLIFFTFGASALFVAIDLMIQYSFGKDIFGYGTVNLQRRLSGPFGDEYIAGSFIQRFYIFAIYFVLLFSGFKKIQFTNFSFITLIAIFLLGALLAGNRVPLVIFIFTLTLFFLFEKKIKHFLIIFLISLSLVSITLKLDFEYKSHYKGFIENSFQIKDYVLQRLKNFNADTIVDLPQNNTYAKEIETGILVWQQNKLFGGGIKSFYLNCIKIENSSMDKYGGTNCNQHPHNYYLHIISELGLLGLLLIILIFSLMIVRSLKVIFGKNNIGLKKTLIPFFIVFIAEIFPLKTTGSFFTSANATFLFIIISFIVGLTQLKKTNI